jgi:GTP-binding protein HflX
MKQKMAVSILSQQHNHEAPKRALLASAYKSGSDLQTCKEHLEELSLLAETCGIATAQKVPCLLRKYDASTYLSSGKLQELVTLAQSLEVDIVIFDDEITAAQQRNLETIFNLPVIDRTETILAVFAQRAQTKEARLQVELAQVKYQAPRLKRMWTHLSRQAGSAGGGGGGGGGYLKGEGEKQIEIDRRLLKKQIELLQREIKEVSAVRETQRTARVKTGIPIFALVGYTNAGKSTLLNALTDADVFVEDKLFATLDTTTRKYTLSNNQEILLIDTVGFIRKLPHLLVAAFKSTLEESLQADILLHLVDVSHPMAEEQAAAAYAVLDELGVKDKMIITLLNKVDRCQDRTIIERLRLLYPHTVEISALQKVGFQQLEAAMMTALESRRRLVHLCVPQHEYGIVTQVIREGRLITQEYSDNDVLLSVELPIALANKLQKYATAAPTLRHSDHL